MGFIGSVLGGALGKIGSKIIPIDGVDGGKLGERIGGLLPFKKGGKVMVMRPRGMKKGGKVKKRKTKAKKK